MCVRYYIVTSMSLSWYTVPQTPPIGLTAAFEGWRNKPFRWEISVPESRTPVRPVKQISTSTARELRETFGWELTSSGFRPAREPRGPPDLDSVNIDILIGMLVYMYI